MQRTQKMTICEVIYNEGGKKAVIELEVPATDEKQIAKFIKEFTGTKNAFFERKCEKTYLYEMDDVFFFQNATKTEVTNNENETTEKVQ